MTSLPKSETLRAQFWQSEILRVMYWLRGEGLGDLVDVPMIEQFLDVGRVECRAQLESLASAGMVVRDGRWYSLSARGLADGEEEFATAFADLARPDRGACSDECWCQLSTDEAAVCSAQATHDRPAAVAGAGNERGGATRR